MAPQTSLIGGRARRTRPSSLRTRALPIAAAGALALAGGGAWIASQSGEDEALIAAQRYGAAWERRDWRTMHRLLPPDQRRALPLRRFAELHEQALSTATATALRTGRPRERGDGSYDLPVAVDTRSFGTIRAPVRLEPVEAGEEQRLRWQRALVFPGLRAGEELRTELRLPPRAALLSRDGQALAEGPDRTPEVDPVLAASIVGQVGEPEDEDRAALRRAGVPAGTAVGTSGLERVFEERLRGTAGGELRGGDRTIASRPPSPGRAVRTTLDLDVQRAAVEALGARLGGVVAMRPGTGELLAVAGIAFSGLQPPGSTFKIVTLAAALESGAATASSRYPVETETAIEGRAIQNADRESCGGTLTYSFAESCNTVFAPLGVKVGARDLVAMAERFGFNRPPGVPGAATSTIPEAGEIGDDLAVGVSAIGQGVVQASALQMTVVAATIANGGLRAAPLLDRDAAREAGPRRGMRVVSARTARTIGRMMREVVKIGTGKAAAIDGVAVAGKTGTAELRSTQSQCTPQPPPAPACPPAGATTPEDTTAWFSSYAPAGRPRVAVGVLLVASGQGGQTAAPAAKVVLQAALRR